MRQHASRCAARLGGHCELKDGTTGLVGARPQSPTMRFDDRAANGETQPQTARFGRVESLEQLLDSRRREAWPRISYLDQHAIRLGLLGADQQVSVPFVEAAHRVDRIHDQIEYYLLQLDPISLDKRRKRFADPLVRSMTGACKD